MRGVLNEIEIEGPIELLQEINNAKNIEQFGQL